MEKGPDFLVDRVSLRPARGGVGTSLDVARKQLDAGEQAAHAAHVGVAVAADLVADAVEREELVLERLKRLEDRLEGELVPLLGRPEVVGNHAVGAEHHDQPLLSGGLIGEPQARQVEQERKRPRANAQVSDEFPAGSSTAHGSASFGQGDYFEGVADTVVVVDSGFGGKAEVAPMATISLRTLKFASRKPSFRVTRVRGP